MRTVSSHIAEHAIREVMHSLAAFRDYSQRTGRSPQRLLRRDPTRAYAVPASALVTIISIAEDFAITRVREIALDPHRPNASVIEEGLDHLEGKMEGGWRNLNEASKRWLSVSLARWPRYHEFRALTEARNAIAHGGGSITRKQQRHQDVQELRLQWSRLGLDYQDRVLVNDPALEHCALLVRQYIEYMDEQIQKGKSNTGTTP